MRQNMQLQLDQSKSFVGLKQLLMHKKSSLDNLLKKKFQKCLGLWRALVAK